MHAHKFWRREAQIKSSESLSECQLPLAQRLLCVCAGRRTAFYISFNTHTHTHSLFLTHTSSQSRPAWLTCCFRQDTQKTTEPNWKGRHLLHFLHYTRRRGGEKTKQALNDFRWADVVLKKLSRIPYTINLSSEQESKLLQQWCTLFPESSIRVRYLFVMAM